MVDVPQEPGRMKTTKEYTRFSMIISNRGTSRNHINNLKNAIQKHPEILQVQPILVNDRMQIIDGQHRFQAASELGVPISYTMVPGIGIGVARAMNVLQRAWEPMDFAKSYAVENHVDYEAYLKARESFEFPHNVTLTYLIGSKVNGMNAVFRRGDLEIEDAERGMALLEQLALVREDSPITMTAPFALAMLPVLKNEKFDMARFLDKLKKNPGMLHRSTVISDYLRDIEQIYNVGFSDKGRTRLF